MDGKPISANLSLPVVRRCCMRGQHSAPAPSFWKHESETCTCRDNAEKIFLVRDSLLGNGKMSLYKMSGASWKIDMSWQFGSSSFPTFVGLRVSIWSSLWGTLILHLFSRWLYNHGLCMVLACSLSFWECEWTICMTMTKVLDADALQIRQNPYIGTERTSNRWLPYDSCRSTFEHL